MSKALQQCCRLEARRKMILHTLQDIKTPPSQIEDLMSELSNIVFKIHERKKECR